MEWLGISMWSASMISLGARLPFDLDLVAGGVLGYLAADLASGLVHWFCDSVGDETTPLAGKLIIGPFREHHRDPQAMTRHGFAELTGNSACALLPVLVAAHLLAPPDWLAAAIWSFSLALFLTNLFHCWAHAEAVPRWIGWLQRRRLILSPQQHARHHQHGYTAAYCVTSGWMNPLLDRLLRWRHA